MSVFLHLQQFFYTILIVHMHLFQEIDLVGLAFHSLIVFGDDIVNEFEGIFHFLQLGFNSYKFTDIYRRYQ